MEDKAIIREFRARQETKKSDSTAKSYTHVIKQLRRWLDEPGQESYDTNDRKRQPKSLSKATTADLRTHLRQLLNKGGYVGGTVNNRVIAFNVFYQELERMYEEGYSISEIENPAHGLDVSDWSQLKKGTKRNKN